MKCPFCESTDLRIHQRNGHACSTMFRCGNCRRFFSERRFTGYWGLKLPPDKIIQIVKCLVEGVSIRSTARLCDVQKNTVIRVLRHAAGLCKRVADQRLRDLRLAHVQVDELHCFTGKKEAKVRQEERGNGHHVGDTWVFLATDGDTKLVPSFLVSGDRSLTTTGDFMLDLASRLSEVRRFQLTSDGLQSFIWGVSLAFKSGVDYGMLIKSYAAQEGELKLVGARPKPIIGFPDPQFISTSYAERNNLNLRTFLRRLTRLTLGFSKKVENLIAALWLYLGHYNFCRIHGSLKTTPAVAAGITDHVWTVEELLNAGKIN